MLSLSISWAVGAILMIAGVLATAYLVWHQNKHGLSIFSVLATSDAFATILTAVGYFINASIQMTKHQVPGECSHGQLLLATALFVAPFINAFLAILCNSTVCSTALQAEQKPSNIIKSQFIGNISAKWFVPFLSVLLFFVTNVSQYPQTKQEFSDICPSHSSVNIFPVTILQLCDADTDTGNYIVDLMHHHRQELITNYKNANITNTEYISNTTSLIINRIYNILQELKANKQTKSIEHQQSNMSESVSALNPTVQSRKFSSSEAHLRHIRDVDYDDDKYDAEYPFYSENPIFMNESLTDYADNGTNHAQHIFLEKLISENQDSELLDPQYGNETFHASDEIPSNPQSQQLENAETSITSEQPADNYLIQAVTLAVNNSSTETTQHIEEEVMPHDTLSNINHVTTTQLNSNQNVEDIQLLKPQHSFGSDSEQSNAALASGIISNVTYTDSNTTEQLVDTLGLCIFECYFSPSFLKAYLFVLLFTGYFLPIAGATILHATTMKGLTMQMKEATQQEKTSADDTSNVCSMQLMKIIRASNTNKHSIITSVLLWTPTLIETLMRVWFCTQSPTWLSTLLFLLGQSYILIQNILNIKLVKCYTCMTSVQPLPGSSTCSEDMPSTFFTKVRKTAVEE